MKSMLKSIMILGMITLILHSACKKDDKDNDTGNPAPEWLIPYQGTYTGTYDGDDWGTWSFIIADSPQIMLEAYSEPDNETYTYSGTIAPDGSMEFSGLNVIFSGTITDFMHISGTWQNSAYNVSGTFEGWKEPGSLNSLLIQINDADGDISLIYEYDNNGRNIKTQYYSNNTPSNYAIRSWYSDEITYTYYREDASVLYQYRNPLPLNNMGLSEYATYINYRENYTRYDTCTSEYNSQGYRTKEIRNVTLIYTANNDIEKGTEIRTYIYTNDNLTQLLLDYSVGSQTHSDIYNYTYYTEYIDYRNIIAPYLGKNSKNLHKQLEIIYSGESTLTNTIYDYSYDFYNIGFVKDEHVQVSSGTSNYEYHNIYYYK